MTKVWIVGDVHGNSTSAFFKFLQNTEVNICLQLGDFGYIWTKSDVKGQKFLNKFERKWPHKKIITVLGNHENYDLIETFPIVEVYGAKAYQIRQNVFAVLRGEILAIEGKTFLCVGGADSTDKEYRLQEEKRRFHSNPSSPIKLWWPQELIEYEDVYRGINRINQEYNGRVDYVLTHCAPSEILIRYRCPFVGLCLGRSSLHLNPIFFQTNFKEWYCGHYHVDETYVLDWKQNQTFNFVGIDQIKELTL